MLGERRLRLIAERLPLLEPRDVDRADGWFARHGQRAVLLGRMVPVVRSLISVPAGLQRMPLGRFVAYTVAGSAIWITMLIGLGYFVGARWETIRQWAQVLEWVVLALLAAFVVAFIVQRLRRARVAATSHDERAR